MLTLGRCRRQPAESGGAKHLEFFGMDISTSSNQTLLPTFVTMSGRLLSYASSYYILSEFGF
jgi:hypothetical protein